MRPSPCGQIHRGSHTVGDATSSTGSRSTSVIYTLCEISSENELCKIDSESEKDESDPEAGDETFVTAQETSEEEEDAEPEGIPLDDVDESVDEDVVPRQKVEIDNKVRTVFVHSTHSKTEHTFLTDRS